MDFTVAPQHKPAPQLPRLTLDSPVFTNAKTYLKRPVEYQREQRPTDQPLEHLVTSAAMRVVNGTASVEPAPVVERLQQQAPAAPVVQQAQPQPVVAVEPPLAAPVQEVTEDSLAPAAVSSWDDYYAQNPIASFSEEPQSAVRTMPRLKGKYLLYALAAVFLLIGIVGGVMFFRQYHTLQSTVNAAPDTKATSNSTDTSVATSNFTVATADESSPDDSVFASALYTISIDSLKIHAPVFAMKLQDNGVLQVPKNIYNVGWYDQSAKPGESGASFMMGHVNGPTKAGIFAHLDRLKEGDLVKVKNGDTEISYKVVSIETKKVSDIDMSTMLDSVTPGVQGLNIMSCDDTSHFNAKDHSYDGRVIVRTVAI